jgi:hypothetical protein
MTVPHRREFVVSRVDGRSPARDEADAAPFDLGAAAEKARAEATAPLEVSFAWGNETFTVPTIEEWSEEAMDLLRENRYSELLNAVLGADDAERLREVAGEALTFRTMTLLFDHIAESSGGVVKRSASRASSRNTTRR